MGLLRPVATLCGRCGPRQTIDGRSLHGRPQEPPFRDEHQNGHTGSGRRGSRHSALRVGRSTAKREDEGGGEGLPVQMGLVVETIIWPNTTKTLEHPSTAVRPGKLKPDKSAMAQAAKHRGVRKLIGHNGTSPRSTRHLPSTKGACGVLASWRSQEARPQPLRSNPATSQLRPDIPARSQTASPHSASHCTPCYVLMESC